ncbi:hypothetical protein NU208_001220 [Vibrio parahaemolyticus]|uniref:hypothetical protein n=1 Tax=Vibrio parahaemolyticus TaxID=670 RepID=UPI000B516AE4|nr:hypothetical protein [Vibrio parahaemolyticus]EGQ8036372.1 hypothetical protein [Vibrio parahaemolyticus]EGQ8513496.1 hypothetical protein [Vibrio parahaemolyticus]EGR9043542.1 hypothetical protein [Vibrio parahaemolyticus]EHH2497233.1 hypothetical protein [Vibrio parahaemolyticus]EID4329011.1 hypothetical protein [Vibrio parahaemolyticus]
MKSCEMPEVTLSGIELQSNNVTANEIETDITFSSVGDYVSAFKEMAEKISDETLIKMLADRDQAYISEDYQ